ncbi:MAG: hypothetical protein AAF630_12800 [Cyanobacteria bacterium P01_C01_bin.38]
MGLPKKGTRRINVANINYRWNVSSDGSYLWLTIAREKDTGQRLIAGFSCLKSYVRDSNGNWCCIAQNRVINPSLVRSVILTGLEKGWKAVKPNTGVFNLFDNVKDFPITEPENVKGVLLQEIALEIIVDILFDISMDEEWRLLLFHAPMGKRFDIPLENEYDLKFAAFNDGWGGDFWVIAIESQDFPAIVEYTYNGAC